MDKLDEESRNRSRKDGNIDYLKECFSYDNDLGNLIWRISPLEHFTTERQCKIWNTKFSNKIAGSVAKDRPGLSYVVIGINYKPYKAHRIIWSIHHGEITNGEEIDHINHDGTDNRLENLRLVTSSENKRNRTKQRNNSTGHTGVHWNGKTKKWRAMIQVNGKIKHLGYFIDIGDAVKARKSAEIENGFFEGHGTTLRSIGLSIKGEQE
ncbi:HNH endonuclease signature motif containing protein [Serratia ficaria]|uniref:HNH endonuclease signature motif containing protein n=1 Tax=Serratia ficaria TaxID=61651 RepID=UPI00217831A8|nr:HNH endonuclease signature motif containing protein [Serratia ficaria]CAI1021899.1 AP2 domain [Serratia ficaria]